MAYHVCNIPRYHLHALGKHALIFRWVSHDCTGGQLGHHGEAFHTLQASAAARAKNYVH